MLAWDLEDWLTDEGDKAVRKVAAAKSRDVLSSRERLLYEFWLFDTEQRNGGVSQYFGNRGIAQWQTLSRLATRQLPSFKNFASKVNAVIRDTADPYRAVIESSFDPNTYYSECQTQLVAELKAAVETKQH